MTAQASPSQTSLPGSVLLIGGGRMGGALLRGWLDQGLPAANITVLDPQPSDELRALARDRGFGLNPDRESGAAPEVVVLAIKPQMLATAAPALAAMRFGGAVLVSVLAGKTVADLGAALPIRSIIRAMPNTPAAVRRGITGAFANAAVTPAQRAAAHALLACVGQVEWLDREDLVDAVTAVSGSGPAYVFFLTECLAEAGRAVGFDAALAQRLARATVEGAGALLSGEPETGADQLRRNVTSPGGTTAAALEVLSSDDALKGLMIKAVLAARDRAVALAG